jgi:hypothetical protein
LCLRVQVHRVSLIDLIETIEMSVKHSWNPLQ